MNNKIQHRCSGTFLTAFNAAAILLASASLLEADEVYGAILRPDNGTTIESKFRRRDSATDPYTRRNTFYCPAAPNTGATGDNTFMQITNYGLGAFRTEFNKTETGVNQQLAYYKVGKGNMFDQMAGNLENSSFYIKISEILNSTGGTAIWNIGQENAMENLPGPGEPGPDIGDKWMISYNGIFSGVGFNDEDNNIPESIASKWRPFDLEIRLRSKEALGGPFQYDDTKFWTPPGQFITKNGTTETTWNVRIGTIFTDGKKKVFVSCSPRTNNFDNLEFPVKTFLQYLRAQALLIPSNSEKLAELYKRRSQIANLGYTMKGFVAGQEIYRGTGTLISNNFSCNFNP